MAKRKGKHGRKMPPKPTDYRRAVPLDEQLGDQMEYDVVSRQIHLMSNVNEHYRKRRTRIP